MQTGTIIHSLAVFLMAASAVACITSIIILIAGGEEDCSELYSGLGIDGALQDMAETACTFVDTVPTAMMTIVLCSSAMAIVVFRLVADGTRS